MSTASPLSKLDRRRGSQGSASPIRSEEKFVELPQDFPDGTDAASLFGSGKGMGYTYDDVILLPGHINFSVEEVNLKSKLTKNIELNIPLVSSPMDTVTESAMAIAMALQGKLNYFHCLILFLY